MKALIISWIVVLVNFHTLSVDTTIDFELNKAYFAFRNNIIYFKGKPVNGTVETHYRDGKIKSKNRFINGIANGLNENYYSNGKLEDKTAYKNGYKNGIYESYFSNGKISIRKYFKNGIQEGLYESFYNTGQLSKKKIFKNGKEIEFTEYDEKGTLKIKESIKDGFIYYESYVDGVNLLKKGKYNKDRREEGKWEIYYGGEFWDDETGDQLSFLKEAIGKLARIENYSDGYLNGQQISFHSNGIISKRENYFYDPANGEPITIGIRELFDKNGKLTERSTFDNSGSRVKNEVFNN